MNPDNKNSKFSVKNIGTTTGVAVLTLASLFSGAAANAAETPPVKGGIGAYYNGTSGVKDTLGQPTAPEKCGFQANGCKQDFQRGEITWQSSVGTAAVRNGGIRNFYDSKGGVNSEFGYATSQVTPWNIGTNGFYLNTKNPTNGATYRIVWSNDTGAIPVKTSGGIGSAWISNPGYYGYPTTTEKYDGKTKTAYQKFSNKTIVWSHNAGTFSVYGGIGTRFFKEGGPSGQLGYPVSNEYGINDGRAQKFHNPQTGSDSTIVWSKTTGKTYLMKGAINNAVHHYYGLNGPLGTPRSEERGYLANGGVYQMYSNGRAYWSPNSGAHGVRAGILAAYAKNGFEHKLGYPTSQEYYDGGKGRVAQNFQNGTIHYNNGSSYITYSLNGWTNQYFDHVASQKHFGKAVSGAFENNGVIVKKYQNGVVTYDLKHGYQAMSNKVYEKWGPALNEWGVPVASYGWGSGFGMQTVFENGYRIGYNPGLNKVMRVDKTLGSKDALVIGDSQVYDTSWVGRGIKAAGYNPEFYRRGGIGFTNDHSGAAHYGSYQNGVVDNKWALPVGNPGIIYIQGSGNDISGPRGNVGYAVDKTISELHRLYPNSKIVVGGVVSRTEYNANNIRRWELDDYYRDRVAKFPYVKFMSEKGWVSQYGGTPYLADTVHFNPQGQVHMAPYFTDNFKKVIR